MSEVKGWDKLMAKLGKLTDEELTKAAEKAALNCAHAHAGAAKLLAPVDSGELRNSIQARLKRSSRGTAVALCYTNSEHAAYVEYGTGPIGAASGGNGSEVKVTYNLGPFRIRRGTFRRGEVAEVYADYWVYRDASGRFFATRGQPAKPFMYPAAQETKRQAQEIQAAALRQFLRSIGKG